MNNTRIALGVGLWILGVVLVGWIHPFFAITLTMIFGGIVVALKMLEQE